MILITRIFGICFAIIGLVDLFYFHKHNDAGVNFMYSFFCMRIADVESKIENKLQ